MLDEIAPEPRPATRACAPGSRGWSACPSSPGELRRRGAQRRRTSTSAPQLAELRVPTLILHRMGDRLIDVRHSRYMAEHIPGARLRRARGRRQPAERRRHRGAARRDRGVPDRRPRRRAAERELLTILFTDIVDSTGHAARLGDARWRDLLVGPRRASCAARSTASAAARSRRSATRSSSRSTARRRARCAAREAIVAGLEPLGLERARRPAHRRVRGDRRRRRRHGRAHRRARRASWPSPARCSSRGPSTAPSSAPGCASRTAARTSCAACPAAGRSSRVAADSGLAAPQPSARASMFRGSGRRDAFPRHHVPAPPAVHRPRRSTPMLSSIRRRLPFRGHGPWIVIAAVLVALLVTPFAARRRRGPPAAAAAARNPSPNASLVVHARDADHRQQQHLRHPPVEQVDNGGGAIYGCRARTGTNGVPARQQPVQRPRVLVRDELAAPRSAASTARPTRRAVHDERDRRRDRPERRQGRRQGRGDDRRPTRTASPTRRRGRARSARSAAAASAAPRAAAGTYTVVFSDDISKCALGATATTNADAGARDRDARRRQQDGHRRDARRARRPATPRRRAVPPHGHLLT